MNDSSQIFSQILDKARTAAAGDYSVLSAGERLAAAIVLNRFEWLEQEGYTMAEAIARLGPKWLAQIPAVAKQLAAEHAIVRDGIDRASRQARVDALLGGDEDEVDLMATFRTHGYAPGYRDVDLLFAVRPLGTSPEPPPTRVRLRVQPEDAEYIISSLTEAHDCAWKHGRPIDASPDEVRPRWLKS